MNKKLLLKKELDYIKSDWIRKLTEKVVNHIPDYFFEIPASSTGKYHPEYTTGYAGLLRHVKAACKIANDVLNLKFHKEKDLQYKKYYGCDVMYSDFIIAALILHDCCKSGYPEKGRYTVHEHPLLAADLIRDSLEEELSFAELDNDEVYYNNITMYIEEVTKLVSSHMGEWTTSNRSKEVLPEPVTNAQMYVHMFDYLASRKYITVNLDD